MPRHDFSQPRPRKDIGGESFTPGFGYLAWVEERRPKRRKPRNKDEGGVPADPRKPKGLSGGAAVELDIEDE